jgi:hypothetical protein
MPRHSGHWASENAWRNGVAQEGVVCRFTAARPIKIKGRVLASLQQ